MAGTVKSNAVTLDVIYSNIGRYQDCFAMMAKTLDSHPGCQRIASYYGLTGSGFGGTQTATCVKNTAWGVWRFNSSSTGTIFDLAVTLQYGPTNFNSAVSGTWTNGGAALTGISFAMAWHSSSAAWNGTTNNNGADKFTASTTQPWKTGSFVFPANNSSLTNKNSATIDLFSAISNNQIFFSVDNDGIYYVVASTNNGSKTVDSNFYAGTYKPILTASANVPLVMGLFDRAGGGTIQGAYGGISYFSGSGSTEVSTGKIDGPFGDTNALQTSAPKDIFFFAQEREKFYEFPMMLFLYDSTTNKGWFVGRMHSMYTTNPNIDTFRFYNTGSRMTVRTDTQATGKFCVTIPWEKGKKVVEVV